MKKEYSYGSIVYRLNGKKIEYLIEYMTLGHVSLPKGHIEDGETIDECVLRELKEELNLSIKLNKSFEKTITYSPKADVIKDVTFYLGEPLNDDIVTQKEEVTDYKYLEFNDAYNLLTYKSDKEVLYEANEFIIKNNLNKF